MNLETQEPVALLDSDIYQDMSCCPDCGERTVFQQHCEIAGVGRHGFCLGCGGERVQRFSRTMEEA